MKSLLTFLSIISIGLNGLSQNEYSTLAEQTIGTVKCVYTKAKSDSQDRYNVSIFFHDIGYGMQCDASHKSISLSSGKHIKSFVSDLESCVTYLQTKKKDGQLVYDNDYYTLVIHDRPNKIFLYSSGRSGYTWLTIKSAIRVLNWMSEINLPSNS